MKIFLILSVLLVFPSTMALAGTDYYCLNQCIAIESDYSACESKCQKADSGSFDYEMPDFDNGSLDEVRSIGPAYDESCYKRCQRAGHGRNQCFDYCRE